MTSFKILLSALLAVIFVIFGISSTNLLSQHARIVMMKLQFGLIVEAVLLLGSKYLWNKISSVIALHLGNIAQRYIKLSVVLFLIVAQSSLFAGFFFSREEPFLYVYISFICLGIYVQLVTFSLLLDTLHWFAKSIKNLLFLNSNETKQHNQKSVNDTDSTRDRSSTSPSHTSKGIKLLIVSICAVTLTIWGVHNGLKAPEIKFVNIPVKGFPSSYQDFKIVQICDIHVGPTVGKSRVASIVEAVNKLQPDILVIVGDLIDGSAENYGSAVTPLKDIKAKFGKFFVTGNHEYISGNVDKWFHFLKGLGFQILHNSHKEIYLDKKNFFYLAGVDDLQASRVGYPGHGMDLHAALSGCKPNIPVVLLAHQPQAARLALLHDDYNIKLVLAGHTHGGQFFPNTVATYLANPFFAGLYHFKGGNVYVSQGTVFWGIPLRTFSTAEISVISITGYGS